MTSSASPPANRADWEAGGSEGKWSDDSLRLIGLAAMKLSPTRVSSAIALLSYRERVILARRFGTAGPRDTYRAIADTHNVSVERVRQIENQALKKICASLSGSRPTIRANGADPLPVEELELPVRAYNCLKRAGINRVDQLTQTTREELGNIPNFGKTSLDEVTASLSSRGLTLADSSRLEARVAVLEREVRRLSPP